MKYSIFSVMREAVRGGTGWTPVWREPEPKAEYDIVIVGGGGHGLATAYYLAKEHGLKNIGAVLDKCIRIEGFRIGSHLERRDQALVELMQLYRAGKLKWRETVANGIEAAPDALANIFRGGNVGKQVVRLV